MAVPTISELHDPRLFNECARLDHQNIPQQLQPHLFDRTAICIAYWALNITFLFLTIYLGTSSGLGFFHAFSLVCLGMMACWLLLVPVHELVHALAYRLIGARDVHISYQWRTLSALCIADRFVAPKKPFILVCLAPFVVINAALIATISLLEPGEVQMVACGVLLLHLGATSGDVALVNMIRKLRSPDLWTYDDRAAGLSYFFSTRDAMGGTGGRT